MKKLLLLLCLLGAFVPGMAQHSLSGRVISAVDKAPLPGASVRLADAATGAVTDTEGYFTLPVAQKTAVLQVSFLGFVTRELSVTLPLSEPLLVVLGPSSQGLQEVVVSTGYQQLPRERATGSFTQVDNATFNQQVGTDVLSRLEAVANGITMDRATTQPGMLVRGLSTINGPRSPLIVVDNFPYEGNIANINPNDVENITILKDAAAASIWGARAGNGVIVITTKKGRYKQPLSAEFHSNVTVSQKPDLSYLPQMNSSDFIDMELFLYEKGYYRSQLTNVNRPVLSPVVELLVQKEKGTLPAEEADARINALRSVDVRDDYDQYVYRHATKQQYALSLKSGSEVLAWNLSAGYDRNLDQLAAGYDRLNLRFHNALRPLRNLTLTTAAAYTQSKNTSGRPGYAQVGKGNNYIYPYARFADDAGNPLPFVRDYSQSWKESAGNGKLLDWNLYPLEDYKHARNTSMLQDVTANVGLNYDWRHGLSADMKYQYERQQTNGRLLQDEESYFTRNLINLYTQLDPATGAVTNVIPRGAILDLTNSLLESQNLRGQLGFDRNWEKHALAAIAGAEIRHSRTTGNTSRIYGYNDDILTFGKVDYTTAYPTFVTRRNAFIPDRTGLTHTLNRFVSQFANAAYTYQGRYTLSLSGRRDASNLFGLNTNELWNPLWSTGLSWDISKEPFYKVGFLPYLKLRSTYGYSGNTNPSLTAVTTMSYVTTSPYTQSPYARFSTYANPDLTWETVGMWNVGVDFSTRDNRVSGSLEYYRKNAGNLYGMAPVDYTTGVGDQVMRNVAAMRGKGLDVEISSINLDRVLQWSSHLNLSVAKDEIKEYHLSSLLAGNFVYPGFLVSGVAGRPVYSVFSYKWAGLDPQTGAPRGFVEGQPSSDYLALTNEARLEDLAYHGSAIPTVFGSLGNTFSWKGFSLTARIGWKMGYYFRARSIDYSTLYVNWGGHADFARRWQQPGDEQHTHVPSVVYPTNSRRDTFYSGSEVLVEKGDHIRLQYITAAYDLQPKGSAGKTLKNMQVYLNLSNLGILWRANRKGLDPDLSAGINALPAPASAALGVKASF